MLNTVIIGVFPLCGTTYFCNHTDSLPIKTFGNTYTMKATEISVQDYNGTEKQVNTIVDTILKNRGKVDFIFMPLYGEVQAELQKRGIPFILVLPNSVKPEWHKTNQLVKQQWLGRMLLKGYPYPLLQRMIEDYDTATSPKYACRMKPAMYFTLTESQYISDIIQGIYDKKEAYPDIYCNDRDTK